MKFQIKIGAVEYEVEPCGVEKAFYRVHDGDKFYDIKLGEGGEWVCLNFKHGRYPLPIGEIGEAIEHHYGT